MPAIRLTELRREMEALAGLWGEPQAFAARLAALLQRYGDRIYRPGQSAAAPATPAYHLPPAAFQLIWQHLRQAALQRPAEALPLAQALWQEAHLEPRLLAARLLGLAPPTAEARTRFWAWLQEAQDPRVQQALLHQGSLRMVREVPAAFLEDIQNHLNASRRSALLALAVLAAEPTFENGPALYRVLRPALLQLRPEERPEATQVLRTLAQRWPQEVGLFLQRVWQEAQGDAAHAAPLAWVLRRVVAQLPPETRPSLPPARP